VEVGVLAAVEGARHADPDRPVGAPGRRGAEGAAALEPGRAARLSAAQRAGPSSPDLGVADELQAAAAASQPIERALVLDGRRFGPGSGGWEWAPWTARQRMRSESCCGTASIRFHGTPLDVFAAATDGPLSSGPIRPGPTSASATAGTAASAAATASARTWRGTPAGDLSPGVNDLLAALARG